MALAPSRAIRCGPFPGDAGGVGGRATLPGSSARTAAGGRRRQQPVPAKVALVRCNTVYEDDDCTVFSQYCKQGLRHRIFTVS
jgi:hypothetical protein